MISEQLKPCPFCGSDNIGMGYEIFANKEFFYASCNKCEAEGPTEYDRDKAIEKWNTRLTHDDYLSNQGEVQPAL